MMTGTVATATRCITESNAIQRVNPTPGYLTRWRSSLEHSDWDEMILDHEEWLDRICIGIVIASALYFLPVLVLIVRG